MPFDPAKPVNNSPVTATELRGQFNALNTDIGLRALLTDVANAISASSNNSNGVANLGLGASDPPAQGEVQAIADKLDELINALRR